MNSSVLGDSATHLFSTCQEIPQRKGMRQKYDDEILLFDEYMVKNTKLFNKSFLIPSGFDLGFKTDYPIICVSSGFTFHK